MKIIVYFMDINLNFEHMGRRGEATRNLIYNKRTVTSSTWSVCILTMRVNGIWYFKIIYLIASMDYRNRAFIVTHR